MIDFARRYAPYLLITILIELLIVRALSSRLKTRPTIPEIVAFNLFTHPLATLAVSEGIDMLPVEGAVFLVEALLYRLVCRLSWVWAVSLSLVANLVTALMAFSLAGAF